MLVLSTRPSEKILLPDIQTSIEVVAIQSGTVRLGITAPEEVRVLREGIPDRVAEWGSPEVDTPTLSQLRKLMDKRLEIARRGLTVAQELIGSGQPEEARMVLDKIDEDLHLLRRRIRHEFAQVELTTCGV